MLGKHKASVVRLGAKGSVKQNRGKIYVLPREALQTIKENPIKKIGRKRFIARSQQRS